MRPAFRFLIALAWLPLNAQGQAEGTPRAPRLPWEDANLPPWIAEPEGPAVDPPTSPGVTGENLLTLTLAPDGRIRVADRKGTLRMSLGLPGRPRRVWRDGGRPLESTGKWPFPDRTPLSERQIAQLLTGADPRVALTGLLWVLDDGERRLTVVHPATGRVLFLRLPEGEDPELAFFPDHLELRARAGDVLRRWSIPWAALMPHLARLGLAPFSGPKGTAFQPFPKDG